MKKKIMCIIIFLLMNNVMAVFAGVYGNLTYSIDGNITITDCTPYASGEIVIPEKIIGRTVKGIGDRAFQGCTDITSVTIPDSVVSIGEGVFSGCSNLLEVIVSDNNSMYTVVDGVLFSKNMDTLIAYPSGIGNDKYVIPTCVEKIDNYAFQGCTNLKSIIFHEEIKIIGDYAFQGCENLLSTNLPNNVTEIGVNAYQDCISLLSMKIPEKVTRIDDDVFSNCSSLMNIVLPENLKKIGSRAFSACGNLSSIKIPDNVVSVEDFAFYNCSGLTEIQIPDKVTSIGAAAFRGCTGLKKVMISEAVMSIGSSAFRGCHELTSIVIPENVKSIGAYAFDECRSLMVVYRPISANWNYKFNDKVSIVDVCKITYKLSSDIIVTEYVELNGSAKCLTPPEGHIYVYTVDGKKWTGENVSDNINVEVQILKGSHFNVSLKPVEIYIDENICVYNIALDSVNELSGKLIVKVYDSEGEKQNYRIHDVNSTMDENIKGELLLEVDNETEVNYKIFLWDDLKSLVPISTTISGEI